MKTTRKLPTVGFPSLLRKFVPSRRHLDRDDRLGPGRAGRLALADLHVDFHGAPASLIGTIRIAAGWAPAATVLVDADFTAHVPLVARRVEGFAAPIILERHRRRRVRTGATWADVVH